MKKSRIIVLFLAVAAAGGAFIVATNQSPPPAPLPVAAPPPQVSTTDVLVAAKDLPPGTLLTDAELQWQPWPKDAVPAGTISKTEGPKVIESLKGSIVRTGMIAGEPIRREKLVKGQGFMSAILPSGMRAVAINIDSQGATSAGGFILPGDRVDVIRTSRDAGAGASSDNYVSETLLQNVKVLAVGPNIQEKNGQAVVVGSNATLELDPAQAETVVLAQRTGQLSLTLRSLLDARKGAEGDLRAKTMTVVRYGAASEGASR